MQEEMNKWKKQVMGGEDGNEAASDLLYSEGDLQNRNEAENTHANNPVTAGMNYEMPSDDESEEEIDFRNSARRAKENLEAQKLRATK